MKGNGEFGRLGQAWTIALLAAIAAAPGCGGGGGGGGSSLNPGTSGLQARFTYSPANPVAGQVVQFTDQSSGSPTAWSWDFNTDGQIDATVPNPHIIFGAPGNFLVTYRVSSSRGSHTTTTTIAVGAPGGGGSTGGGGSSTGGGSSSGGGSSTGGTTGGSTGGTTGGSTGSTTGGGGVVDIDVDTNRDGLITNTIADEDGESTFTPAGGAVLYDNVDDDDSNNVADASDSVSTGNDAADLARIVLRRIPGLAAGTSVTIDVTPAAAQSRVRIFRNAGGSWTSVYAGGASFSIPAADLAAADIELGIEVRARVSSSWSGDVTLTLRVGSLGSDTVRLQVAPLLLCDNTWPLEQAVMVDIPSGFDQTTALKNALQAACQAVGAQFRTAYGPTYSYDRWIQDSHETGVVFLPSAGQARRRVDGVLQLGRRREVDDWCADVLWGPNFGFIPQFGTSAGSLNYGGNLEIAPPHTSQTGANFPLGRIVVGGGTSTLAGTSIQVTDHMDLVYRQFFDTMRYQAVPHLEISSEWLAVGHIDEYLAFIPAPARPRGWALAIASPALARQLLQGVASSGGGSKTVFQGRTGSAAVGVPAYQTTVNAILQDTTLQSYNNAIQVKLDAIRAILTRELGLTAADIVELPVLFENVGQSYAAAYNPGVVNLVVVNGATGPIHLLVPDPEGPDHATDVWQNDIRTKLQALGTASRPVQVTFVDVFNSYHVFLGEAHCGTNFVRTPPANDWWNK